MKVLAVLAIISLAVIDGRNVLKGRNKQEVFAYVAIVALVLAIVVVHILYNQPFILTKLITITFRPITEPLILFLHSL